MMSEEVLCLAVKVERKAAEIYRHLYDRFRDDDEAANLWNSMAVEEEAHAKFIEAEMRMMRTVPYAFGKVAVDIAPLKESLEKMEEIDASIRKNPVTLEKALSVALQIEREMVEEKYNDLVRVVSPSLKKVFANLTGRTEHVARLDSFSRNICKN